MCEACSLTSCIEMDRIWREYKLAPRTRFNTKVTSVRRARRSEVHGLHDRDDLRPDLMGHSRWIINDGADGVFDAVIVSVGTCGEPRMITLPGMPGHKEKKHQKPAERRKTRQGSRDLGSRSGSPLLGARPGLNVAHGRQQSLEKVQKFFDLGEVHDGQLDLDTSGSTDLGVWEKTKPKENSWDVGRNQVEKKEQGFPTPGEVFEVGEDPQDGSEDVSFVHEGHSFTQQAKSTKDKEPNEEEQPKEKEKKDRKSKVRVEDGKEYGEFKGPIVHSSQLDAPSAPSFEGKTVAVIGGGASAVEAVETALAQGAKKCVILVRDDKVRFRCLCPNANV